MWIDPIIEEIHSIRKAHASRFNDNLQEIVANLIQLEKNWPSPKIDVQPQHNAVKQNVVVR